RDPAPGRDPRARHDGRAASPGGARGGGPGGALPAADRRRRRDRSARGTARGRGARVSTHAGAGLRAAGVLRLVAPQWTAQRRRLSQGASVGRTALLVLVAAVFWLVLFALMYRMLRYFQGSGVGDVLALKLLSLLLLAFLSILLLSNI